MRVALGIAYDGRTHDGWQSQPSGNTMQDHLERAVAAIAGAPVRLHAAGRTDAGVHALGQVAHFDADAARPESAWVRGVNAALPDSIAVHWARVVGDDFHARFAAIGRSYDYVLYNDPVRPALFAGAVGWFHLPLDVAAMQAAAIALAGRHDFTSFRAAECQAKTPIVQLARAEIHAHGRFILFRFRADRFLHHMVRNLVGALVYVGKGNHRPEWLGELLAARDRRLAPPTFSAAGLYLSRVEYDARFGLPDGPATRFPLPFAA